MLPSAAALLPLLLRPSDCNVGCYVRRETCANGVALRLSSSSSRGACIGGGIAEQSDLLSTSSGCAGTAAAVASLLPSPFAAAAVAATSMTHARAPSLDNAATSRTQRNRTQDRRNIETETHASFSALISRSLRLCSADAAIVVPTICILCLPHDVTASDDAASSTESTRRAI